jgi:tetratricopeptide (TPR) repeat protein
MMVIGSFFRRFGCTNLLPLLLTAAVLALPSRADDEIVLKNGSTASGQITGVSGGQVTINLASGKSVVYLSDIQTVTMTPPAAFTELKEASPATVIATLEPLTKQYAGLPANWVLDAMGKLADAYDAEGQAQKSSAIYAQINQLYPNSPFQKMAVIGTAKIDIQQGKIDDALNAVKPLVDQANQNLAPSAPEGRLYAGAFLVYGQVLQAQKQYPQALEAYLTVETMFYQNPALVDQADQFVQKLRALSPGVSVD